ncbi:CBL-interacting serine threonine-protein kinase 11, partial [Musa troglodytarum]
RGFFHRDLKPENLLLDDANDLKISDFGLSALCSSDDLLYTQCGTPAFVAPEILLSRKGIAGYDGAKADIWSCGVILFVLHAGSLPFNDHNLTSLYRKIHRGHHRCPRWTPADLRRLISRLLDPNPATRISVDGILRDPWFARGFDPDQLAALVDPNNSKIPRRIGGGELNAFDLIISFASGLDLSGLFTDAASDRERFASSEPADRIMDRVEEVGETEGLVGREGGREGDGGGDREEERGFRFVCGGLRVCRRRVGGGGGRRRGSKLLEGEAEARVEWCGHLGL